jgi:potassium/chloride transporter 9
MRVAQLGNPTDTDEDTLILQLGYILLSVPTWKKAFRLRILVFVEYESEVEEEHARLRALLEKLRIEAEIHVFWLASGQLTTYENIVNGKKSGNENDNITNELLKGDDWWQELQRLRSEASQASRPQVISSLGEMLEATRRRGSSNAFPEEDGGSFKRFSIQKVLGLQRKPSVSKMSKPGVNFGIHTHHLGSRMIEDETYGRDYGSSDDDNDSSSSSDADFNDVASAGDVDDIVSIRQASVSSGRRKSHGDLLQYPSYQGKKAERTRSTQLLHDGGDNTPGGYGTIKSTASLPLDKQPGLASAEAFRKSESTHDLLSPMLDSLQAEGKTLTSTSKAPPRPALSRNSSMGRFSSRPVPETRVHNEEGGGQRLMFAEPEFQPSELYIRSRRNSATQRDGPSNLPLNIPELLESYQVGSGGNIDARSNYSTQSLPLSFNDLPSRAQHLILNELMKLNSSDTAVLLTTLPIPEEGTCKNEEASLRYLSDIEVLCHELPPVLLVLSNNMTVTVSL